MNYLSKHKVLKEVQEKYVEWLEMSTDPQSLILGVMLDKVVKLQSQVEYLEKRLKNATK